MEPIDSFSAAAARKAAEDAEVVKKQGEQATDLDKFLIQPEPEGIAAMHSKLARPKKSKKNSQQNGRRGNRLRFGRYPLSRQ